MASQAVARGVFLPRPSFPSSTSHHRSDGRVEDRASPLRVVQSGGAGAPRAYGLRDVEAGLTVTTDTQFLIGSVTKDERHFDWKKPVRDYIPEFRLYDAVATDRVTVLDLLCHHSGLPRLWMSSISTTVLSAVMSFASDSTSYDPQGQVSDRDLRTQSGEALRVRHVRDHALRRSR